MAGMFYSLQEAAKKLNKTEKEIKELVKIGRLREFRDGPNLLFKVDEVESLLSDTSIMASKSEQRPAEVPEQEEEISLVSEPAEEEIGQEAEISDLDTVMAGEDVDVLGETDKEASPAEDTMSVQQPAAEEESIEKIEEDVSLDSFGSGSGLLDLSLQADDTSLGGILDEIYTGGGEEVKEASEAEAAAGVVAEAEQILPEMAAGPAPVLAMQAYAEPEADVVSNALGLMLFLPLLAVIYTAVVAVAGLGDVMPAVLATMQSMIWYVLIGIAAAAVVIVVVALVMSSQSGKAPKKAREKKPAAGTQKA